LQQRYIFSRTKFALTFAVLFAITSPVIAADDNTTTAPAHSAGVAAHASSHHSSSHHGKSGKSGKSMSHHVISHHAAHVASASSSSIHKSAVSASTTSTKPTASIKSTKSITTHHHSHYSHSKHTKNTMHTKHKSSHAHAAQVRPNTVAVPTQEAPASSANSASNSDVTPVASAASSTATPSTSSTSTSTVGQRVVSYVHNSLASLRYSVYKTGGNVFDKAHGIYEVDCSHYVDNILQKTCPSAYASLASETGTKAPDSANYYHFFQHLTYQNNPDWNQVADAKQLQPGDILVFRYQNRSGYQNGGHVMMVMDKPTQENDSLLVRVSDSAYAGHSDDTRPLHDSGVGIGTLLLKINQATGQPFAYAWQLNAPVQKRVNIVMARPVVAA
jgi:hypothetical protein